MNIEKLEKWGTIIDATAAIIIATIILYLISWWLALHGIIGYMLPFGPAIIAVLVVIFRLVELLPYDSDPVIIRSIYKAKIRKEFKKIENLPADKSLFGA